MTKAAVEFLPDWVSCPGATIRDLLADRRASIDDLAKWTDQSPLQAEKLASGLAPITDALAAKLAGTLGSTKEFWLRRQALYQADLDRLFSDEQVSRWLSEVPIGTLAEWGRLSRGASKKTQFLECLAFFDTPNVSAWRTKTERLLTATSYRWSVAGSVEPASVAAWLRQGELLASSMRLGKWSADGFRDALQNARKLTKCHRPEEFLPQLQGLCAAAGVAVVVLRTPPKCPANGATKALADAKSLILLSGRYRTDDQFWFTFFHEAGHIVLHQNQSLIVEGPGASNLDHLEREANDFAENILVPSPRREEMLRLPLNRFAIARFAKSIGVSTGIVVGQLQHAQRVPHHHFNDLKRKYDWAN